MSGSTHGTDPGRGVALPPVSGNDDYIIMSIFSNGIYSGTSLIRTLMGQNSVSEVSSFQRHARVVLGVGKGVLFRAVQEIQLYVKYLWLFFRQRLSH